MDQRSMEIANIEHEIAWLRGKLANIERWSRIVWPSFALMCAVVLGLGGYSVVAGEMLAVGLSFVGIVFLVVVGLSIRQNRLIDFASLNRWGFPELSHAVFLEKAIAKREKRLAELRARS